MQTRQWTSPCAGGRIKAETQYKKEVFCMDYRRTDPEFAQRMEYFARTEVGVGPDCALDPVTRSLAVLAALMGCQGVQVFRLVLPEALDNGLTPVMAREMVYQAVDYLGLGRMLPSTRC